MFWSIYREQDVTSGNVYSCRLSQQHRWLQQSRHERLLLDGYGELRYQRLVSQPEHGQFSEQPQQHQQGQTAFPFAAFRTDGLYNNSTRIIRMLGHSTLKVLKAFKVSKFTSICIIYVPFI
ncbi:MAG: hypothetical protein KatS3mg035_0790 [Bacteroidia bacterium]|nr:MAG: hypothetical protein KatS3mg035_0790 [Bacteroidia bacterium]